MLAPVGCGSTHHNRNQGRPQAAAPCRHSLVPHCTQVFGAPAAVAHARKGGDAVPSKTAASCSGAGATKSGSAGGRKAWLAATARWGRDRRACCSTAGGEAEWRRSLRRLPSDSDVVGSSDDQAESSAER